MTDDEIHTIEQREAAGEDLDNHAFDKDWTRKCEVCGQKPVVLATGLCGPCTWGESDTIGGNW